MGNCPALVHRHQQYSRSENGLNNPDHKEPNPHQVLTEHRTVKSGKILGKSERFSNATHPSLNELVIPAVQVKRCCG